MENERKGCDEGMNVMQYVKNCGYSCVIKL